MLVILSLNHDNVLLVYRSKEAYWKAWTYFIRVVVVSGIIWCSALEE